METLSTTFFTKRFTRTASQHNRQCYCYLFAAKIYTANGLGIAKMQLVFAIYYCLQAHGSREGHHI